MRAPLCLALGLFACSHARSPSASPAAPTPAASLAAPTVAAKGPPGTCRITGDGEVEARAPVEVAWAKPLAVFATATATEPIFVVGTPGAVRIAWELKTPPPTNGAPRARVELGGQRLVRYRGWASGLERGFQLRTRHPAGFESDHRISFRAGTEVDVLHAWESGDIRVRPRTGLDEPYDIDVPCADVVYQPTRVSADDGPVTSAIIVGPLAKLHLLQAPGETTNLSVFGLRQVWVHEKRDGFTRVTADQYGQVIDAWVPDDDLTHRYARRKPPLSTPAPADSRNKERSARVKVDAPLYVGDARIDDAFVEAGAEIYVEGEAGGRTSFSFVAGDAVPALLPPGKKTFSILTDTLVR